MISEKGKERSSLHSFSVRSIGGFIPYDLENMFCEAGGYGSEFLIGLYFVLVVGSNWLRPPGKPKDGDFPRHKSHWV